jgi:hypothetical protein
MDKERKREFVTRVFGGDVGSADIIVPRPWVSTF